MVSSTTGNVFCSNAWGGTISNLQSGQSYNVIVTIVLSKSCNSVTLATAPMTASAK
jgi:hypothetical protein